jgi:hypothetical protein
MFILAYVRDNDRYWDPVRTRISYMVVKRRIPGTVLWVVVLLIDSVIQVASLSAVAVKIILVGVEKPMEFDPRSFKIDIPTNGNEPIEEIFN